MVYPDGYTSRSPADVFEKAYFPVENGKFVTWSDVDAFVKREEITHIAVDGKAVVGICRLLTGFSMVEVVCVGEAANADDAYYKNLCTNKLADNLHKMLSFVVQWANKGLKR